MPGNPDETGPMRPETPCPPAPACSVPVSPPPLLSPACLTHQLPLPGHVQLRDHLLHRSHRGTELLRIARANHEIGVRLLVLVDEGIAADHGIGMGVGDLPE